MWFDEWMNLPEGGRGKPLMLVAKDEYVSGANLVSAEPTPNPQSPTQLSVAFTFNRKGARELSRFTGENVGRFTAIILDGKIKSFPVIKSKIPDGRGVIEGSFTDDGGARSRDHPPGGRAPGADVHAGGANRGPEPRLRFDPPGPAGGASAAPRRSSSS